MTFAKRVALLFSTMACAQPAEAPMPSVGPDTVVAWGVSQFLWGDELLVVDRDGTARYAFTPGRRNGRGEPLHASVRLPQMAIERLHDDLAAHHVCQLTSKRAGIPDEGMPALRVRFPDLSCEVSLWDGEWNSDPDAHACFEAIERIRRVTQRK
jgi:hypothetical protein